LSDFFGSMHDVNFCLSSLDGAEFTLRLALAKLPCRIALCHFFDINKREFVVVRAVSPVEDAALLFRTPERTRGVIEAMSSGRAMLVANAIGDERFSAGRWAFVGEPVQSLLVVPIRQGGRFLGLLELANPTDGAPFTDADANAFTYLAGQLAEFLGQRGISISPEQIRAYRRT
jgi:GAF domain-containing protein